MTTSIEGAVRRRGGYIRYFFYFLYIAIFRFTPDAHRPYALFFPWLRRQLLKACLEHCGRNVHVKSNADVSPHISVGDNSELGRRCQIYGGVTIGADVLMGPDVKLITRNHRHSDATIPIRSQGESFRPITICDDVWIGANVVVLPGVTINSHAIIGAGAIVTKDVPAYGIAVGNPARVIADRRERQ